MTSLARLVPKPIASVAEILCGTVGFFVLDWSQMTTPATPKTNAARATPASTPRQKICADELIALDEIASGDVRVFESGADAAAWLLDED